MVSKPLYLLISQSFLIYSNLQASHNNVESSKVNVGPKLAELFVSNMMAEFEIYTDQTFYNGIVGKFE